ncbi:MAG: hypothetical protein ACREQ5_29115 [Candidatus Dormibacteria bacterium]
MAGPGRLLAVVALLITRCGGSSSPQASPAVPARPQNGVLAVSAGAVHTVRSTFFVCVLRHGQVVRQPVTIGARDPVRTQITSGLKLGEEVVLPPAAC